MTDWSLRLARPDDADSFPAIEESADHLFKGIAQLEDIAADGSLFDAQGYRRLIAKGHCLVALQGERSIGFIATEPFRRELHMWQLAVHEDAQRLGVGSGLVRACMIDARNSGFKAVTLTTFRDLPWNAPFYEGLGFEEVTALDAHPRLANELALEADQGLPVERRCAMIRFLD
ncbi:MAG: GNAT family N-acetyltransferase [Erythrobacteraceae bacterium]|nr:GNAT family N-acetyltransferase [Erythrobacteraceae bacterium]